MSDGNGSGASAPWLRLQPPAALARVVAGASVAVVLVTLEGYLVHANAGARDLLGLDPARLLGAFSTDVFGLTSVLAELLAHDRRDVPAPVRRLHRRIVRPDDSVALVELRVAVASESSDDASPLALVFLHEVPTQEAATNAGTATAAGTDDAAKRDDRLLAAQLEVLRLVATAAPLDVVLDAVVGLLDGNLSGTVNAIVIAGGNGEPKVVGSALDTRLTQAVIAYLNSQAPLPQPGDLATAGHRVTVVTSPVALGEAGRAGIVTRGVPAEGADTNRVLAAASGLVTIALDQDRDQQALERRAFHDELTGLANRNLLLDRLGQALKRARRRDRPLALMFVDLDRFKAVNDTFGHHVGDGVLQQFAERLRQTVRPEDTVARFGGDEFVVLIEQIADERDVDLIAERLDQRLAEPFVIGDRQLHVTASVGLVVARGEEGEVASDLLRNADVAMYRAKQLGRNRREVFDDDLRTRQRERTRLAGELRDALASDAFVLHYQPVIDVATGTVGMVEALLRWVHPERGLLAPPEFLAAAEDAGLMPQLGDWVLHRALAEIGRWPVGRPGGSLVRVAVNAGARQLSRPGAAEHILRAVQDTGVAPARLALELTEEAFNDASPAVLEAVTRLRQAGIAVTIDDFGTGSTALSSLRRGDIDLVKLDRRFVAGLGAPVPRREQPTAERSTRDGGQPADDAQVARAVIAMAHAVGIAVVAEGVDTEPELTALRTLGCDLAQGELFAPPMPAEELAMLLTRTARW